MTNIRRTFGVVLENTTCDAVAKRTMRAAQTWGGEAALFVYPGGTTICMAVGSWLCDTAMRNDSAYLVGVYEWHNNDQRGSAYRAMRERISDDVWVHLRELRESCAELQRRMAMEMARECGMAA